MTLPSALTRDVPSDPRQVHAHDQTVGSFDDDSNPSNGYGWMCRLVDAGVLQAAGFYRARKPLLPL